MSQTVFDRYGEEYNKCSNDFIYYSNKYLNTFGNKTELYPYQLAILDSIKDEKINIITKSRRMGFSKLFLSYILWKSMFNNDISTQYIFPNISQLSIHRKYMKELYDKIPTFVRIDMSINNRDLLEFRNGSKIWFNTPSDNLFIGKRLNYIIYDEAQFIKDFRDLWTASIPCLTSDEKSKVIAYSTLSPDKTFFKELYEGIDTNINKFKVTWYQYPGHDDNWYQKYENILGKSVAQYEMNIVS